MNLYLRRQALYISADYLFRKSHTLYIEGSQMNTIQRQNSPSQRPLHF